MMTKATLTSAIDRQEAALEQLRTLTDAYTAAGYRYKEMTAPSSDATACGLDGKPVEFLRGTLVQRQDDATLE